ncbi:hypothetical protein [Bradyrhizobium sp. S3.7.6]
MKVTFTTSFMFGDKVKIDSGDIVGIVTGFCFYPHGTQVQVSWWNSGTIVEQWIADWRLKSAEAA